MVKSACTFIVASAALLVLASVAYGAPTGGTHHSHKTTRKPVFLKRFEVATPTPDPRIMVYIFAFSKAKPSDDPSAAIKAVHDLGLSINKLSLYRACDATVTGCSADGASIYVHGMLKSDDTVQASAATFSESGGFRTIGALTNTSLGDLGKLTYKDLVPLIGNAVVDGGSLVVAPGGYQEFVQLVPGTVNASDPDYASMLQYLLGQRGISSFRSQMTLGALGSNPGQQPCTQGQEYLVYSMDFAALPHKLIGLTRMQMQVFGALLNCNTSDHVTFAGDASKNIPTTKSSLLSYSSLFALGFTKLGWTAINTGIGTASGFADTEPTSVDARAAVAEAALRNLVDNFCSALPTPTPTPSASPMPAPSTAPAKFNETLPPATTRNGSTSGATVPNVAFDPSSILGSEPYVPRCVARPQPTKLSLRSSTVGGANGGQTAQSLVQDAAAAFSAPQQGP